MSRAPHFGLAAVSTVILPTFTPDVVKEIARVACPRLRIKGNPDEIAYALNISATELLLALTAAKSPTATKAWAGSVAKACADLRSLFKPAAHRAARRLEVDPAAVAAMMGTLHQVEARALWLAKMAGDPQFQSAGAKRPTSENAWLECMQRIFHQCFNNAPTIVRIEGEERGGNFARFTAEAALRLINEASVHEPPAAWHKALQRFSSEKKVAGRLEHARKAEIK